MIVRARRAESRRCVSQPKSIVCNWVQSYLGSCASAQCCRERKLVRESLCRICRRYAYTAVQINKCFEDLLQPNFPRYRVHDIPDSGRDALAFRAIQRMQFGKAIGYLKPSLAFSIEVGGSVRT